MIFNTRPISDTTNKTSSNIDYIDNLVSKRVRMHRIKLGYTQADVSHILNVSIQQVQKYEKGTNRISSGKLSVIAQFFRIPITYFFDDFNNDHPILNNHAIANDKDILNFIKDFHNIQNPKLKKAIVEFIKSISS